MLLCCGYELALVPSVDKRSSSERARLSLVDGIVSVTALRAGYDRNDHDRGQGTIILERNFTSPYMRGSSLERDRLPDFPPQIDGQVLHFHEIFRVEEKAIANASRLETLRLPEIASIRADLRSDR